MIPSDICRLSAVAMARLIRAKQLSARETLSAHLDRIARLNPKVNAVVTLVAEQATAAAQDADDRLARGETVGPLHGLPIAHKDLQPTRGIRTTFGSPVFRNLVPSRDSLLVERIRAAGAITIGKTNTPEFGAGAQTFNPVFGTTLNPYDVTKTCGGSSGGAAVALACGMLPLADGSDMGGSLRVPASFCNVVGLRTSPGRVPIWPAKLGWSTLSVDGPMARSVADVAFFLSAIAGPDPRSPLALDEDGRRFAPPLERDFAGVRVAWWTTLGGLPVDSRIRETVNAARRVFEAIGCRVDEAEPDFSGAHEAFHVVRALGFSAGLGDIVRPNRHVVKDAIVAEVERGDRLTGLEIGRAEATRTELYHRMRRFMEQYEFFVLPVTQAVPFEATQPYVTEIQGTPLGDYIDWVRACYYISILSNPAVSVPCGFTPEGLPVGLQIVGRHRDDRSVLQMAYAFEQAAGVTPKWPGIVQE